ncbi:sugar transferase [Falsigemmobacter faecalis]|uniref:Sugar transferase n=1 Tax=Falsigemmobacter faecalis TaxID=2488730 RepID=A0A3P3DQS1_9RHOB|nr:sugar transferase [Falsigemmobacter faecalis]RRH76565.1 sugar transferase [Falsigemmobacter faecalis]
MTPGKRLFDVTLALLLATVLALPFGAVLLWLLLREGRPLFYRSERMRAPDQPFVLWKLRSMAGTAEDRNTGVTGADKAARITRSGALLRRYRLDEIPQIWNVLRGDMSFVGPRPPLRRYTERLPQLYAEVLRARPGLTGLATLTFHRHEAQILAQCHSPKETEEAYIRRCIPRKARLDLMYLRHRSLCFDLRLLAATAGEVLLRRQRQD